MSRPEVVQVDGGLSAALAACGPYVLVTDPVPAELFARDLAPPPAAVVMPASLDRDELEASSSEVADAETVVGFGGGMVLDAAKYLAHHLDRRLILVPTIASTNTAFTPFASVREDGSPVGQRLAELQWRVVVDLALLRQAEPRLNRAGFGDLLGLETATADGRLAVGAGRGPDISEDVGRAADEVVDRAIAVADEVGRTSDRGIATLVDLLASWSELSRVCPPLGAGTEHLFAWNLERVTGQRLLHGEAVALGTVIAAHLQDGRTATLREALDRARVPWRPAELGLARADLEVTLTTLADYNRTVRRIPSVVDDRGDAAISPDLWEAIT